MHKGFLSTPDTLLHPVDGTERGSHTTPDHPRWKLVSVLEKKKIVQIGLHAQQANILINPLHAITKVGQFPVVSTQ